MCQANKKTESGSALVKLLAIRLSEQTTLVKSLVMRASVGSGKSTSHFTLPTSHFLLLATIFFYTPTSFAERADRNMPINLEADQVLIDDALQISTFTGNVRLSQGSLLIRGDKIVVMQDKGGFKHATAYGKTADFRQKREGMAGYVEGYGERIEYDTRSGTFDIHIQARLKRDQDEVLGEHITYNINTEIFQVNGSSPSSGDAPPQRVRAVLQPKSKEGAASTPDTTPVKPGEHPVPTE